MVSSESKVKRARFFHDHWSDFGKGDLCLSPIHRTSAQRISSRPKIDKRTNNALLVEQRTLPHAKRALSRSVAARFRYEDKSDRLQKEWEWKMPALRDRWSFAVCMHTSLYMYGRERCLSYRYELTSLSSFLAVIIPFQSPNIVALIFFYLNIIITNK